MRRSCTLATSVALALSIGAGRANAAHLDPSTLAARAAVGAVTGLSVVPANGTADVLIALSGPVAVQHFTVDSPNRIVIDLTGARLLPLENAYDRHARGGITNVRASQYRSDVVRIVLDLDAPRQYQVLKSDADVRISVTTSGNFVAWHSQNDHQMVAETTLPDVARADVVTNVSLGMLPPPADSLGDRKAARRTKSTQTIDSLISSGAVQATADTTPQAVADDRAVVAEKAPVEHVVPPALPIPLFAQQSQQPRINVTYNDADIRAVIAGFAAQTGRTIVVGKSVTGTVTAEIKDQPWDVALKHILEAQGLAATEDASGIITVDSYQNILAKQASEPLATQLVKINYVSAASMLPTVKDLLSKDCPQEAAAPANPGAAPGLPVCITRGTVAADSGTNSLLVTEVSSRMPELLEYVHQLDVRTPQVALKAKIISVNRTAIEELGLSYDLGSSAAYLNTLLPRNAPGGQTTPDNTESRVTLGGDALAGVANAQRKYKSGSALNMLFSTALGKYSLTSFLDALREQDLSDIQAEPSVVTLDNRQARILVGQETPVRVIDAGSASQIGAPVRANVQYKETGIILTVTPHITNNRQIRMSIEAEQSSLNIVGGDLGFIIDKRNAATQLLVGDGETAVIGGLTQTSIAKNRSGIPLLSDLPLIGRLFSQYDSREIKQDLLILITPHIIDEGAAVRPPDGSK